MDKTQMDAEWARLIADIKRLEKEHPNASKVARAIRFEQKRNKERDRGYEK